MHVLENCTFTPMIVKDKLIFICPTDAKYMEREIKVSNNHSVKQMNKIILITRNIKWA